MKNENTVMSFAFIGFGALSMFGMILLEIFSALYIYQITGSLVVTYMAVALQMVAETALTYTLPWLLRRCGPGWLLVLSVPFRIAAFALLLMPAPGLPAIFAASLLISMSSTASEVPRGILLAAVTANKARGLNLGLFEALRYGSLATAPLVGGYAFEVGGFVTIAALSTVLSVAAAAFAVKVQAEVGGISAAGEADIRERIIVPWPIRVLWWSTGVRYLGENCLYPLLAVTLYASTIKLGWIAATAAVAGIVFGALADRIRADVLLILALLALTIGWAMRSQAISFEWALAVGLICAIGGKAAGILEKKASYDFGDRYLNSVYYIGRREREMLLARAAVLVPCIALGLSPSAAIVAVAVFLFANICVAVATRLPGDRAQPAGE